MTIVFPNQPVPNLILPTVSGRVFDLHKTIRRYRNPHQQPSHSNSNAPPTSSHYTILVMYRGLHCPICKDQLRQIEKCYDRIIQANMTIVAISMDDEARARAMSMEVNGGGGGGGSNGNSNAIPSAFAKLPIAYNMTAQQAQHQWGLHLSHHHRRQNNDHDVDDQQQQHTEERAVFSEPGLFVIDNDTGKLVFKIVQSGPYSRPNIQELVEQLSWARKNVQQSPASGDVVISATGATNTDNGVINTIAEEEEDDIDDAIDDVDGSWNY